MVNASRSARATFFGRCLISLAVVTVLMAGGVAAVNRGIDNRVAKIHRIHLTVAPAPPGGANFLIIGSDTRAFVDNPAQASAFGDAQTESGQRSDTLMVAHVEPGSQHTFVVSFPRDLMVNVPGISGKSMINAAFNDGAQKVVDTLRANFGIEINHYLQVDFQSFQSVVDAIGRVNIYIPGGLRDPESGFRAAYGAGCYGLTGPAALAYVRSRHMQIADPNGTYVDETTGVHYRLFDGNSDLDRIKRQQTFIRKLASVAIERSLGDPFLATDVADRVLPDLKADQNLSRGDINALIRAFRTVNVNDTNAIRFETLPVLPDPNDSNRLIPDEALDPPVIAALRTFGDNTPKPPTVAPAHVKVRVLDGTGAGNAVATATVLAGQGFVSLGSGTGPTNLAVSQIRYGTSSAEAAKTLLDYVPDAALVPDKALDGKDEVVLVLGKSFQSISVPPTTTTTTLPPGVTTTAPPSTSTTTTVPPTTTTTPPDPCPN